MHGRGCVFRPFWSSRDEHGVDAFTRAGTNGVDKSFSYGSCGETGDKATSEMRFPHEDLELKPKSQEHQSA
jgi:hypothetical protein